MSTEATLEKYKKNDGLAKHRLRVFYRGQTVAEVFESYGLDNKQQQNAPILAALFADALNVFDETGYTPRQLLEQRDSTQRQFDKAWDYAAKVNTEKANLLKACKQALYDLKGREHDQYLRDIIAKMEAAP